MPKTVEIFPINGQDLKYLIQKRFKCKEMKLSKHIHAQG